MIFDLRPHFKCQQMVGRWLYQVRAILHIPWPGCGEGVSLGALVYICCVFSVFFCSWLTLVLFNICSFVKCFEWRFIIILNKYWFSLCRMPTWNSVKVLQKLRDSLGCVFLCKLHCHSTPKERMFPQPETCCHNTAGKKFDNGWHAQ